MSSTNFRIALYLLFLWMAPPVFPAEAQLASEPDLPPNFFRVYSQSGNETFQAECRPTKLDHVTCHFMGIRVNEGRNTEARTQLEEFKNMSPQDQKKLQKEFSREIREKDFTQDSIKPYQDKLNDPNLGPKTRKFLQELGVAYQTGDFKNAMELLAKKEKQTSTVDTQSFSLDFQRIGKWKWVSNPGPGGLCNFVKIYELIGEPLRGENKQIPRRKDGTILSAIWKMTETRVAADDEQPMCADVKEELNKPTIWSWQNPAEYELSCDFVTFRSLSPR